MSTKKLKLMKKYISCCEDESNRKDRYRYLSVLFCRKSIPLILYSNIFKLEQRFTSFGKFFQTDGAKKEIQF